MTLQNAQSFLVPLIVDLAFALVLIWAIYFRAHRDRTNVFTCLLFNVVTFSMCLLLRRVPMELGFALGLFAVFGVLRYRTEPIRIVDLTYLFVSIGLAIVNGIAAGHVSWLEVLGVNVLVVGLTAVLQRAATAEPEQSVPVLFDELELLAPQHQAALLDNLSRRCGLRVVRAKVNRVDLLRDAAELTVFYTLPAPAAQDSARAARERLRRVPVGQRASDAA